MTHFQAPHSEIPQLAGLKVGQWWQCMDQSRAVKITGYDAASTSMHGVLYSRPVGAGIPPYRIRDDLLWSLKPRLVTRNVYIYTSKRWTYCVDGYEFSDSAGLVLLLYDN